MRDRILETLGYLDLPPGRLATLVVYLEMREPPAERMPLSRDDLRLRRWERPEPEAYRRLFRRVGEPWLWFSRLLLADEALCAVLHDPAVEVFVPERAREPIGLLELDFRREGECELAFFGLVPEAIGKGAGRWLMDRALALAWRPGVRRFWVHTCHFDHPAALGFYLRTGFRPYKLAVEVFEDPRLKGVLPRSVAPHVPLLEPEIPR
ncbi:MAG: GNAT family N-acetyltransferase [Geminicoccaceae bacterium]|nr:GNAT family N-acetyltransferase [Geminicoccaceae bacterium]